MEKESREQLLKIEGMTCAGCAQAIKRLLTLSAKTARLLRDGREVEVPIDTVSVGDVMVIRPGEKVPTDGVIEEGESHIDESIVTGESMPVRRGPGERVVGATVNSDGLLIDQCGDKRKSASPG